MTLEEVLDKTMLDLTRYAIFAAVERAGNWIIVQVSTEEPQHFCLQYAGCGHYFNTLEDLNAYSWKRWKLQFTFYGGVIDGKRQAKRSNG